MFAQQVLNGVFLGAVYALFAVGYTLVFGVLDILNLAHAAIFTAAAFSAFSLATMGVPLPAAFLAAAIVAGILGILLDKVAFAPLRRRNAGTLVPLISSIGVAIIIGATLRGIYGVDERHFATNGLDAAPAIHVGPVTFTTVELAIFAAAIALMLVLSWILRATTLGRRIRAVAEDRVAAALLGVNLERTIAATFFIASSLGGAAGVLTGLRYNSVTLDMGGPIELKGLAIIILGGMGSVTGAVVGAFIIGAVETLATALGLSEWRDAITFGVMFLILVLRPTGLFGKRALRQA
ncbi:branched-chain amino acid ABC transporter permease [Vulcanimicrobium alpinum]|uniref:Branched-chain amino acid ABC transporter permease n=1 Tax=Vulcanimicrobium alpinum TaxID=3016050 RepID=A0AAN2C9K0_UNVUL|nr:branched-chain amino acid ABC transporter permease [Vulcanimicrobium alpinum]BDE06101.1 branched-chain amino acid ABC transporter permease [Vulcanimicrobium alpinum]